MCSFQQKMSKMAQIRTVNLTTCHINSSLLSSQILLSHATHLWPFYFLCSFVQAIFYMLIMMEAYVATMTFEVLFLYIF